MTRKIIEIPRFLMAATTVNWSIEWRGQSAGTDTAGGEQVVYNAFPRFVGSPSIVLHRSMIGIWRAIMGEAEGRVNAYRVPMVDLATINARKRTWRDDLRAYQQGVYQQPKDAIICTDAVAAGATTIAVDESAAREPVRLGAFLSYNDWPMLVTGRSGSGANTVLTVKLLRTAIPAGGEISLFATGIYIGASDAMGFPSYDPRDTWTTVDLDFAEWINR